MRRRSGKTAVTFLPEQVTDRAVRPQERGPWAAFVAWWGPRPVAQITIILALGALLLWFGLNAAAALQRAGISPGFDFLGRAANFQIGEAPIPFQAGDTYLRAISVGLLNTLKAALSGCLFATCLGVALGVLSLTPSRIIRALVRGYIEVIRNTPLLLQLFFWIALARALPGPRQAPEAFGVVLSNRGIFVPALTAPEGWALPLAGGGWR